MSDSSLSPAKPPKACPRCGQAFDCRPEDIARCQCAAVPLTAADREYIAARGYGDCLCAECLRLLRAERLNEAPMHGGT